MNFEQIRNILTIDVEDYFQVSAFENISPPSTWSQRELRVEKNTDLILSLLDEHHTQATFFILGWIAERCPALVHRINNAGHEIASHGYGHQRVYNQSRTEFRDDIRKSKKILEDLTGKQVFGYRAPSYSISPSCLWAFDELHAAGFSYDSSVFPIRHDLYGMPDWPRFTTLIKRGENGNWYPSENEDDTSATTLLEIPITTLRLAGRNMPIAGGGYFRFFPYAFTRWGLSRINNTENRPFVFYIHPWELDPEQPRMIGATPKSRFRHYLNLHQTEKRLKQLLIDFNFTSIKENYFSTSIPISSPISTNPISQPNPQPQSSSTQNLILKPQSLSIRLATKTDQQAWDDYVLSHHEGLAYHLFAWKMAVEKAYRFRGLYLLAERKKQICGVLPLICFSIPFLGHKLVSLPYCDAGGTLTDDDTIAEVLLDKAKVLMRIKKTNHFKIRSLKESTATSCNSVNKVRMVLALPENAESLLKSLKSKLRSQIKKPLRDGLTAKIGGLELVPQFYTIFAENMRDLGSPVHSLPWIENIVNAYGKRAKVAVVYTPEGSPAAAGIILLHPATVSIPWASSLRRYNRLNPNMLLYWTFLSYAADHGFQKFDFGRSTPGEGTYKFKEQWGAKAEPLHWFDLGTKESESQSPLSLQLRQKIETLWRKLPVKLTTVLGPCLRRYVDL